MSAVTIGSWLLTYLVHSTILLGAAWLAVRLLGDRRLALQEAVLRTALVGGLLTATMQVGFGIEPAAGVLALDGPTATNSIVVSHGALLDEVDVASPPSISSRAFKSWPLALLSLWAVGSTLALAALGRSVLDLRRLLGTRRIRPAGQLLERLADAMGFRRRVRFSTSEAIAVPFATGIRHPEICCPERVGDLAREHRRSLFAHELAHLARRDPAWQLLYRIGEAILFLQPLNRVIRSRLEEIAEHLTDERAVACTGDRLGLARCLVVIAHWGLSPPPGVPAAAFSTGPRLDRRVRHLISGGAGRAFDSRWTIPLLVVALAASVVLLPVISATAVHADVSYEESNRLPAKTWSDATDASATVPAAPLAPDPASAPPAAPKPVAAPVPAAEGVAPEAPAVPSEPAQVAPPADVTMPHPVVAPVSEALPSPGAVPASAEVSGQPPRPEEPPPAPTRDEEVRRQADCEREVARAKLRDATRQRSEAEARLRERARTLEAEARARAAESRERAHLTEAERQKIRTEASQRARIAWEGSREQAERARERAREAAERAREWAEANRTEARARAREAYRLSEERFRELHERARRLAEEAERER